MTGIWLLTHVFGKAKDIHPHATREGACRTAMQIACDDPEGMAQITEWSGHIHDLLLADGSRLVLTLVPLAP